jgi:hypothetical protein
MPNFLATEQINTRIVRRSWLDHPHINDPETFVKDYKTFQVAPQYITAHYLMDSEGNWKITHVVLSGYRVLKSGKVSVEGNWYEVDYHTWHLFPRYEEDKTRKPPQWVYDWAEANRPEPTPQLVVENP